MTQPFKSNPRGSGESTRADSGRIAIVLNGNARSVDDDLVATLGEVLAEGGWADPKVGEPRLRSDLFVTQSIDEVAGVAHTILDRGYDTVLTGGGDGTFTSVVTALVQLARQRGCAVPRFGLLRLGTGNSLAWVVGVDGRGKRGLSADLRKLRASPTSRPLRLVEVEGRLSPFCGLGIDANVLADFHQVRAHLRRLPAQNLTMGLFAYGVAAATMSLPNLIRAPLPDVRVINLGNDAYRVGPDGSGVGKPIRNGEVIFQGPARMVGASTICYYGFGFRVFPFAEHQEDRMNLRITTIGSLEFLRNARALWRGEYRNTTTLFDFLVDHVLVEIAPSTSFQIGGDAMGTRTQVEMALSAAPIDLVDLRRRTSF